MQLSCKFWYRFEVRKMSGLTMQLFTAFVLLGSYVFGGVCLCELTSVYHCLDIYVFFFNCRPSTKEKTAIPLMDYVLNIVSSQYVFSSVVVVVI